MRVGNEIFSHCRQQKLNYLCLASNLSCISEFLIKLSHLNSSILIYPFLLKCPFLFSCGTHRQRCKYLTNKQFESHVNIPICFHHSLRINLWGINIVFLLNREEYPENTHMGPGRPFHWYLSHLSSVEKIYINKYWPILTWTFPGIFN